MVMDKPVYLTAEGKTSLEEELTHLKMVRRPEVAGDVQITLDADVVELDRVIERAADEAHGVGNFRVAQFEVTFDHRAFNEHALRARLPGAGGQPRAPRGGGGPRRADPGLGSGPPAGRRAAAGDQLARPWLSPRSFISWAPVFAGRRSSPSSTFSFSKQSPAISRGISNA